MAGRAPPRFFLAGAPGEGAVELLPGEQEHARRVLRLGPGDRCEGLDGRGRVWPLRVATAGRRGFRLERTAPPRIEPAPGEAGAPLPWVEVAVAWPRRGRATEMVGRLVQLGAAAITPLVAGRKGPQKAPAADSERWHRVAREACKQCGRAWLPKLHAPCLPLELVLARPGAAIALLDPEVGMGLDTWARSITPGPDGLGTRERPIVLAIGPEGGFSEEEISGFQTRGATAVRVAPHVLRIETAAEVALAVVAAVHMR